MPEKGDKMKGNLFEKNSSKKNALKEISLEEWTPPKPITKEIAGDALLVMELQAGDGRTGTPDRRIKRDGVWRVLYACAYRDGYPLSER